MSEYSWAFSPLVWLWPPGPERAFSPLVWFWPPGPENCLVFQITLSFSSLIRVTLRKGMEQKIEFYSQLFRPKRCFNMAPLRLVETVIYYAQLVYFIIADHCTDAKFLLS